MENAFPRASDHSLKVFCLVQECLVVQGWNGAQEEVAQAGAPMHACKACGTAFSYQLWSSIEEKDH